MACVTDDNSIIFVDGYLENYSGILLPMSCRSSISFLVFTNHSYGPIPCKEFRPPLGSFGFIKQFKEQDSIWPLAGRIVFFSCSQFIGKVNLRVTDRSRALYLVGLHVYVKKNVPGSQHTHTTNVDPVDSERKVTVLCQNICKMYRVRIFLYTILKSLTSSWLHVNT